jgi:hypothetical protein
LSRLVAFVRGRGPTYRPIKVSVSRDAAVPRARSCTEKICKTCHGDPQLRNDAIHLANKGETVSLA